MFCSLRMLVKLPVLLLNPHMLLVKILIVLSLTLVLVLGLHFTGLICLMLLVGLKSLPTLLFFVSLLSSSSTVSSSLNGRCSWVPDTPSRNFSLCSSLLWVGGLVCLGGDLLLHDGDDDFLRASSRILDLEDILFVTSLVLGEPPGEVSD